MATPQVADPAASIAKFDRELAEYRELEGEHRRRGWLLVKAEFPEVLVVMAAPQLKPPAVITGVLFDYTDYDFRPPSVRMVDPFTGELYVAEKLPMPMPRRPAPDASPNEIAVLMQNYGEGTIPFLCLPGVREYHDHPGHSGDPWELHRTVGAGRLVRLLEVIDTYGIRPLAGYNFALVPQFQGWAMNDVPA